VKQQRKICETFCKTFLSCGIKALGAGFCIERGETSGKWAAAECIYHKDKHTLKNSTPCLIFPLLWFCLFCALSRSSDFPSPCAPLFCWRASLFRGLSAKTKEPNWRSFPRLTGFCLPPLITKTNNSMPRAALTNKSCAQYTTRRALCALINRAETRKKESQYSHIAKSAVSVSKRGCIPPLDEATLCMCIGVNK
jgi:hypothetical protein